MCSGTCSASSTGHSTIRVHEQPFHFRAILLDVAQGLLFRLQIQRIQRVNVAHGCIGGLLVSPVAEMAPT